MASTEFNDPILGNACCKDIAVIVVDSNETFRGTLAAHLRQQDHPVHEYADPYAVAVPQPLAAFAIGIIAYDETAPERLRLADDLHRQLPQIQVVLLTDELTASLEEAAAQRAFVHLRVRSANFDELHSLTHRLLRPMHSRPA